MRKILFILMLFTSRSIAQTITYGNNPDAGAYLKMKDSTRIYYEVYGSGKPLVLLHGGLYGDISEYEKLIPVLSRHFKVIAIETRGHAKSEIGQQLYTYSLMADDAYTVIRHITADSVLLVGFSDGAVIAMGVTINHPEAVKRLVFAGGNISSGAYRPDVMANLKKLSGKSLEKNAPDFVNERKKLMPDTARWDEFVEKLKNAWVNQVGFTDAQIKSIKCPVLIAAGDRDTYNPVASFLSLYKKLAVAQLAIIPNADHIIFYRQPELMEKLVMDFVMY
ncbi:alpha/beta fold hydrolase [Mucilaginibacter sp. FT3.2]|uniref:alpha/beta fold hydrolase n=1 Tax=Mucilaginibacter sp. FT3.2 TaxID=2723090 RepID=UPI00160EA511|nr:alpha/beta hydrolase [Mucilaginibacter sp. FT3.2]MBB6234098.1 pimeloyl-ACP methyl ester carboxylesterase [Mucilaginibacter sp. FT3.2]